jgi:hypothetical protein
MYGTREAATRLNLSQCCFQIRKMAFEVPETFGKLLGSLFWFTYVFLVGYLGDNSTIFL